MDTVQAEQRLRGRSWAACDSTAGTALAGSDGVGLPCPPALTNASPEAALAPATLRRAPTTCQALGQVPSVFYRLLQTLPGRWYNRACQAGEEIEVQRNGWLAQGH